MYELVDKPFMNEQMRNEITEIVAAQERATEVGGIRCLYQKNHS
jgi:hypothetical protein